jgi:glucokinase
VESSGAPAGYGALDIGGTKIRVACLDAALSIIAVDEFPTASASSPHEAVGRAASFFQGVSLAAFGIGCTGPVDPALGIVGDVELLPGWQGFALKQIFEDRLGVPVALENDCDAAALGESAIGAGREATRFIYVSISTGIGAGIVFDSHLYRGHLGVHPELGHMVLDPTGPACYCGARGCWESLASGPALVRLHASARNTSASNTSASDARQVFQLARAQDPQALAALQKFRTYTAQGLGNLITLFAPQVIAVGGGVMNAAAQFFPEAASIAQAQAGLVSAAHTHICAAALGQDAVLAGAAVAAQQLLFSKEPIACTPA